MSGGPAAPPPSTSPTRELGVLLKLARLADIDVVGLEQVDGSLSATIDTQPLQAALDTILEGFSFSLTANRADANTSTSHYTLKIEGPGKKTKAGHGRMPIIIPAIEQMNAEDTSEPPDPDEEEQKRTDEQELAEEFAQIEADGLFDPKAPLGPLVEASTGHDNRLVRIKALQVLNGRDPARALKPLLQALTDNDDLVVKEAVQLLGHRDDPQSLQRLGETLLKERDTSARLGSLQALAVRADPASVPMLKQAADDKDPFIKDIVGQMLAEFAFREKMARTRSNGKRKE